MYLRQGPGTLVRRLAVRRMDDPRVQPGLRKRTQGGTSCAEVLEGLHLLQSNASLAYIRHLLDHVSVRTTEDYDRLAAGVMLRELRSPKPQPAGLPRPATYGNPPQNDETCGQ